MTTIERNPDVELNEDPAHDATLIPEGYCLLEGKLLMRAARSNPPIPFGVATRFVKGGKWGRRETIGLILKLGDDERMRERLAKTVLSVAHRKAREEYLANLQSVTSRANPNV